VWDARFEELDDVIEQIKRNEGARKVEGVRAKEKSHGRRKRK
jgi:hypothetical protein